MKKKLYIPLIVIAILFLTGAIFWNIDFTIRKIEPSDIYSEEDINAAMDAAEKDFKEDMGLVSENAKLYQLEYDEKWSKRETEDRQEDSIVINTVYLYSVFGEYVVIPPGSINFPNYILCRNEKGEWEVRDWGYA